MGTSCTKRSATIAPESVWDLSRYTQQKASGSLPPSIKRRTYQSDQLEMVYSDHIVNINVVFGFMEPDSSELFMQGLLARGIEILHPARGIAMMTVNMDNLLSGCDIVEDPTVDWGMLPVLLQVPEELPRMVTQSHLQLFGVLRDSFGIESSMTFAATCNNKRILSSSHGLPLIDCSTPLPIMVLKALEAEMQGLNPALVRFSENHQPLIPDMGKLSVISGSSLDTGYRSTQRSRFDSCNERSSFEGSVSPLEQQKSIDPAPDKNYVIQPKVSVVMEEDDEEDPQSFSISMANVRSSECTIQSLPLSILQDGDSESLRLPGSIDCVEGNQFLNQGRSDVKIPSMHQVTPRHVTLDTVSNDVSPRKLTPYVRSCAMRYYRVPTTVPILEEGSDRHVVGQNCSAVNQSESGINLNRARYVSSKDMQDLNKALEDMLAENEKEAYVDGAGSSVADNDKLEKKGKKKLKSKGKRTDSAEAAEKLPSLRNVDFHQRERNEDDEETSGGVYLRQLQSQAKSSKEEASHDEVDSSTNQKSEMSTSAEQPLTDLISSDRVESNGNGSHVTPVTDDEKTVVKNGGKVTFNEINLHHNVVNLQYSQRPKNKVLKRKNTPASLPKVTRLNAKEKGGDQECLEEGAEEEDEEAHGKEEEVQGAYGGAST